MRQVTTILGELLKIFPRYEFEKLEKQHQSNRYTKYYTGWQQLVTLLFAQIGGLDSLRGIETSLGMHSQKWYHLGLKDIKRSTLSDAMKNRPYEIYEGLFYKLLDQMPFGHSASPVSIQEPAFFDGCYRHRSLSQRFSLGHISPAQRSYQTALPL